MELTSVVTRSITAKIVVQYRMLQTKPSVSPIQREQVLRTYRERVSLRGLERIFEVARQTILKWLEIYVCQMPIFLESLMTKKPGVVLELDEAWSFVYRRDNNRWS